jgi:hypothetical protein
MLGSQDVRLEIEISFQYAKRLSMVSEIISIAPRVAQ